VEEPIRSVATGPLAPPSSAPSEPASFKIVPMEFEDTELGLSVGIDASGSLTLGKDGKSSEVGQVRKNAIVHDGKTIAIVLNDGIVRIDELSGQLKFADNDDLVLSTGTIAIDNEGIVTLTKTDGTQVTAPLKVHHYRPEGRRLCAIVFVLTMIWHAEAVSLRELSKSWSGKSGR
jgi:hypothetical protein